MIDFHGINQRNPRAWDEFKRWTIDQSLIDLFTWRIMESTGSYKILTLMRLAKQFFAEKGYRIEVECKNGGYGYTVYNCWSSIFYPYQTEYEATVAALARAFEEVHI